MLVSINPARILILTIALILLVSLKGKIYWQAVWQMSWRMKWLWLSLLILYGWFIPGSPVFFTNRIPLAFIPSSEGIVLGSLRALVLFNIITAVVLLIKSTSKEALIVSIMWLMTPLKLLKIDTGIFAARLVLTMERVTDTEMEIKKSLQENANTASYLQRGIDVIARFLIAVEQQASKSPDVKISLPFIAMPRLAQWSIPIILSVTLYLI